MRRYRSYICDSVRWWRFETRPGDVVITTPSKCGTTWMQTIVAMLIFGRVDLPAPMGLLSPWLDMRTRSAGELFSLLGNQAHRRFIKTHTPLDGLPADGQMLFLAVARHPLDAMMSNLDHGRNMDMGRTMDLQVEAGERAFGPEPDIAPSPTTGPAVARALRRWIDDERAPMGTGLANLAEYADQVAGYWAARDRGDVELFHYQDMVDDLDGEMRRVAARLEIDPAGLEWDEIVEAAGLRSMRARARDLAPDAHLDLWRSDEGFFAAGGRRQWSDFLDDSDRERMENRLVDRLGVEAAGWALNGR